MKGLLAAVRKYPVGDADPLENFVTEAWAWLLNNNPTLSRRFLRWSLGTEKRQALEDATWDTQRPGPKGCIYDLIATTDEMVAVYEHKVWSPLLMGQLERYEQSANTRFSGKSVLVACVTGHAVNDIIALSRFSARTWREVREWIERNRDEFAVSETSEIAAVRAFAMDEFCNLLRSEGFGPMKPIEGEVLRSYFKMADLEASIKQIFGEIEASYSWKPVFAKIPTASRAYSPGRSIAKRWGRLGIEFGRPEDWIPGMFFGVLLDWEDHSIPPLQPETGPELCLVISFDRRLHRQYPEDTDFRKLVEELRAFCRVNKDGWRLFDQSDNASKDRNLWHPLALRQSLSLVLEGKTDIDEQIAAIKAKMEPLLMALLGVHGKCSVPSFLRLRAKFGGSSR
jgi:hypothetical protein